MYELRLTEQQPLLINKKGADMKRLLYQRDGSQVHGVKVIIDYFTIKEIQVINWPQFISYGQLLYTANNYL